MLNMSLEEFRNQMTAGGAWVLNDAARPMKIYVQRNSPEKYEEEIKKYNTPQKFIKNGSKIVVVSISKENWAGIYAYDMNDIIFREVDGTIVVLKEKRTAEVLVSASKVEVDEAFRKEMLATGYVSAEEYDKYMDHSSQEELPLIRTEVM